MSFDYDPYAVMTIIKNADGTFSFLCDSCGGGFREGPLTPESPLSDMRDMFDDHVLISHKLTPEHTATWHKGH